VPRQARLMCLVLSAKCPANPAEAYGISMRVVHTQRERETHTGTHRHTHTHSQAMSDSLCSWEQYLRIVSKFGNPALAQIQHTTQIHRCTHLSRHSTSIHTHTTHTQTTRQTQTKISFFPSLPLSLLAHRNSNLIVRSLSLLPDQQVLLRIRQLCNIERAERRRKLRKVAILAAAADPPHQHAGACAPPPGKNCGDGSRPSACSQPHALPERLEQSVRGREGPSGTACGEVHRSEMQRTRQLIRQL
jgi:hypothetical protein